MKAGGERVGELGAVAFERPQVGGQRWILLYQVDDELRERLVADPNVVLKLRTNLPDCSP